MSMVKGSKVIIPTGYLMNTFIYALYIQGYEINIEKYENYQKRSGRNRCQLLSPQGMIHMSIPLKKGKHQQLPISQVEISYEEDWVKQHLRTIQNNYSSAAYYEYYPQILELIRSRPKYLWELNSLLHALILNILEVDQDKIQYTEGYHLYDNTSLDFRSGLNQNINHLEHSKPYPQVFDSKMKFTPHLSILDLIFNLGPESRAYLKQLSITFA